jgi:hypothetical protein
MRVPSLIRAATVESGLRLMIRPLWKAIEAQMGAVQAQPL